MGILIVLLMAVALPILLFVYKLMKLSYNIVSKHIKNKLLAWTTACVPLVLFIIGACLDFIDIFTVTVYLMLIVAITKLIFYIIKKIFKKSFNEYTSTIVGLIITTILMSFAYYSACHVEETYYTVHSLKDINTSQFRIVQIADSHIGNILYGKDLEKYVEYQLKKLRQNFNRINLRDYGIKLICFFYKNNKNKVYKEIKLQGCNLNDNDIKLLIKCIIEFNIKINSINISDNELTDESIESISNLIKGNNELANLIIKNNNFSKQGKKRIKESVKNKKDSSIELNIEI